MKIGRPQPLQGVFGTDNTTFNEYQTQQNDYLNMMRQREPQAFDKFMYTYRGIDLNSMPMRELKACFEHLIEPRHFTRTGFVIASTIPQPKTWFEEIQAEVNEWLKEIK